MTGPRAKFDFASSKVPSLANVTEKVGRDRSFPKSRRASTLSSLARLAKWSGQDPTTIPFAEPVVEALLDQLHPDLLGISAKRLANARSDLRFVLERHRGGSRYFAPFSPAVQRLWSMLTSKYERCSLSRLLRFLSARDIDPARMDESTSRAFLDALRHERRLRIKPETFHQSAIRAWNRAVRTYPSWPQIVLEVPRYKASAMRPWSAFPPSLEQAVDRFLEGGDRAQDFLFDENAPPHPLKANND